MPILTPATNKTIAESNRDRLRFKSIIRPGQFNICEVGHNSWLICECDNAKNLRLADLGLSYWSNRDLFEII